MHLFCVWVALHLDFKKDTVLNNVMNTVQLSVKCIYSKDKYTLQNKYDC